MSEEKPSPSSADSFRLTLVLLFILLILFPILFYFFFLTKEEPKVQQKIFLSGPEIAEKTGQFLTVGLSENGRAIDGKECSDGKCTLGLDARLPDRSWRMLGVSGLYSKTPKSEYKDLLNSDYNWIQAFLGTAGQTQDAMLPVWNLHQIYRTFRATQEKHYLSYFMREALQLLDRARWEFTEQNLRTNSEGMLSLTLSRQLAQAAILVGDPDTASQLLSQNAFQPWDADNLEKLKNSMIEQAVRIMTIYSSAADPHEQDSCWFNWAKLGIYTASKEKRYLDEVTLFLDAIAADQGWPHFDQLTVVQYELPCLDMLSEATSEPLRSQLPKDKVERYEARLNASLQRLVRENWDFEGKGKCSDADNGFLGLIKTEEEVKNNSLCLSDNKVMSDNGWLMFLFSSSPKKFEIM